MARTVVGRSKVRNYFIKNPNNIIHYEPVVREKLKIFPTNIKKRLKIDSIWQHRYKSGVPEYLVSSKESHNNRQWVTGSFISNQTIIQEYWTAYSKYIEELPSRFFNAGGGEMLDYILVNKGQGHQL